MCCCGLLGWAAACQRCGGSLTGMPGQRARAGRCRGMRALAAGRGGAPLQGDHRERAAGGRREQERAARLGPGDLGDVRGRALAPGRAELQQQLRCGRSLALALLAAARGLRREEEGALAKFPFILGQAVFHSLGSTDVCLRQ